MLPGVGCARGLEAGVFVDAVRLAKAHAALDRVGVEARVEIGAVQVPHAPTVVRVAADVNQIVY